MENTKKTKTLQNSLSVYTPVEISFAKQSSRFARTVCSLSKLSQELLLMAIGTINTFPTKNKYYVEFSIQDFLNAFCKENFPTVQIHKQIFNAVMNELCRVVCYENLEKYLDNGIEKYRGHAYTLFTNASVDTGRNVKLTFNKEALDNIQELKPYEIIEFNKAAKLKSKHAFNIYKYALSKQGFSGRSGNKQKSWWFELEIGLLKAYLGVSENDYKRVHDFQLRCLTQPIEDINNANIGIHISYSSIKVKKKIVAFRFECKETSDQLKIAKTDSPEEKQEKREINEDWAKEPLWARMQEKYPEVWAKYFEQEKHSGFFVFDEVAKNATYERMLSEGFEI